MTRIEAHELLYAAEAGADVSSRQINEALCVTGDVDQDAPLRTTRRVGDWERTASPLLRAAEPFDGLMA